LLNTILLLDEETMDMRLRSMIMISGIKTRNQVNNYIEKNGT